MDESLCCVNCQETNETVKELLASHREILGIVSDIKEEVAPLVESLRSSPILKMMGI